MLRLRDGVYSLQVDPPIPTQQKSSYPLHTFLGFLPSQHVLSLSLRDAADGREMPANGKLFLAAQSSRGTRKVSRRMCPLEAGVPHEPFTHHFCET